MNTAQLRIEAVGAVLAFKPVQVIELALACGTHPFAGRHLAGNHSPGVLTGDYRIGSQGVGFAVAMSSP